MTRSSSPSERDGGERPPETVEAPSSGARWHAVIRGPAFGVPAAPPGGNDAGAEPIRIVDPAGEAIAWVVPGSRAGCVGFAVRREGANDAGWVHVFPPVAPAGRGAQADGAWISPVLVLREVPSDAADDRWATRERPLRWRFAGRDPTAVVLAAEVETLPSDARRRLDVANLELRFAARLDDAALALTVSATHGGTAPVAFGLGLRFVLAPPGMVMDVGPDDGTDVHPGAVVARGRTPGGAPVAVRAMEGVRQVEIASADGETTVLTVRGYRPPSGLEELPPGRQTSVSANIGLLDE